MIDQAVVGKILVVDDESDILEIISYNLKSAGYDTVTAKDGSEAIQKARIFRPDLIMLDIMMPNKNGIDTCREIRKIPEFKDTMVLFLTALNDEKSEIDGLNMGADDYIAKPIKPKLLVSRINALFRRLHKTEEMQMQLGDLIIDREKFTVTYKGQEIILAKKEFELLQLLASKPGRVFLRNEILNQVWGTEVIVGDRTIDVHIRKIRQKIGIDLVTTVKGVGYKFEM
ncbi:two-component system, OmpR family, alkaline phosphatase synthesis response regulator PhoP [Chitinophaga rupis]|jgi:two-component system alkaline phosphatase synthesis response regulator PhoP|uniref:Phosphate regulon transcriptional regulatory protein PhoB n=1 Tax=Chitinophaga rupis TaxID=573321 RepID=A0A1H8HZX7_9BACT|nr:MULTISPECIES: response regulator transcription factor [Chitinophaga]SEN61456.1 two-component system, OmpR family, alkaline phosphatase synthesis response regulator PhoP [Chitinophaga rupis]